MNPRDTAATGEHKAEIATFWTEVYRAAYADNDSRWTPESLGRALDDLEDMFRLRRHIAVTEMPIDGLAGKTVLEIGPGAGGHSAMFARHGARVIALDIAHDRAVATEAKLDLLGARADGSAAMQGDAEILPFPDASFDIVYANGVLHHTPDTERAIADAWRVLKPGGRAVIMLYCKSSFAYWFTLWFCVGILKGGLFRSRDWLGPATEWIGTKKQTATNPITRCYTRRAIERMFAAYEDPSIRKSEFYFYLIPKIGRIYRRWQIRHYGTHPGGVIVYGDPWPFQSPLEVWLGRYVGWVWNIAAIKPAERSGGSG